MASYALEGCPAREVITVAADEFEHMLGGEPGAGPWVQATRAAAQGAWTPASTGVALNAADTLAAVVHVLAMCGDDLEKAIRYAVSLGGDTDTVAAITGGILGCRTADAAISWLDDVILPDAAELERLSAGLREVRRAAYA
jgi:ADP-ribosyl-[dinitrogen reductase] hydrolase